MTEPMHDMSEIKTPKRKIKETSKSNELICYYCDKEIKNLSEVVFKPVGRWANGKNSLINRMFHMKCLDSYIDRARDVEFVQAEASDWDKCYQYFKKEYMEDDKLEEHAVRRLLGLRLGKYYPKGNNTRILDRGYPFSTIYKAMVVAKFKAKAYASNVQFTDYQHKVNTFMKFIASEVVDVQMRIDKIEKDNLALQKSIENNKRNGVKYVNYLEERLEDNKKNKEKEKVEEKSNNNSSIFDSWEIDIDDEEYL